MKVISSSMPSLHSNSMLTMPAEVSINPIFAGLKRQISAITDLWLKPECQKFHAAILNRDPAILPTDNPSLHSGFTEPEIEAKYQVILGFKNWNKKQRLAIEEGCKSLRGLFSIIQGFPGVGKSDVIAAIIYFFLSLRMPLLCGAATM